MLTGVAGSVGALAVEFVSPDSFSVFLSITLFVGSVVGGAASIFGAIAGAAFIVAVPPLANSISKSAPGIAYGAMLILCLYVMPSGVAGLLRRLAPARPLQRQTRRGNPNMLRRRTMLAAAATGLAAPWIARAAGPMPGVTKTSIKIGQTMPYSGPASAYGAIGRTEAAYIKMLNASGGINGRTIDFLSVDDAYSPPRTVEETRRLVESEGVAFIFQGLGTPCQSAVRQYMNAKKVPQLFVSSGADKWGDYEHFPWTMGGQPSYRTEAGIYAKHLLQAAPSAKLAVLYQNDDFGKDYLTGLRDTLGAKYDQIVIKTVSYETSDPTVDSQIVSLQSSGADALVTVATPKFAAQAIKKVAEIGWHPAPHYLTNVSLSAAAVMIPAGGGERQGHHHRRLLQGPERPAMGQRPRNERVARLGQAMGAGCRSEGLERRLRLSAVQNAAQGAGAVRRRPLAREHHAPGREPA